MTIKETEKSTGLSRSNIRFYEKEGLIARPGQRETVTETTRKLILKILKKLPF